MTGLFAILALGFLLGVRHATDPDHVIAVTTIVTRQRTTKSAALIGAFWGMGHTLTLLVVGGSMIVFGWVIPERVGLSFEFAVALMLIALGVANLGSLRQLTRAFFDRPAGHRPADQVHRHGDYVHSHAHGHAHPHPHPPDATPLARLDRRFGGLAVYQWTRPVVIGIVHGLAGSAAVALLILPTIRDPAWSLFYLFLFGAGTIAGMMIVTVLIAWPFASRTDPRLAGGLRVASGLLSVGFGCFLAWRVGVVDGLFT